MSVTHNKGGFTVEVHDDGAIYVQPGDTIGKYSMAIQGDFKHLNEYSRKVGGVLKPVANVNVISAGETLYHTPGGDLAGPNVALSAWTLALFDMSGSMPLHGATALGAFEITSVDFDGLGSGKQNLHNATFNITMPFNRQSTELMMQVPGGRTFEKATLVGYSKHTLPEMRISMTVVRLHSGSAGGTGMHLTLNAAQARIS